MPVKHSRGTGGISAICRCWSGSELPEAALSERGNPLPSTVGSAYSIRMSHLLRSHEGWHGHLAAVQSDKILDALFGDVVTHHAVAFGVKLRHVDVSGVHAAGAAGDDAGPQQ